MWQVAFNSELQKLALSITPVKEAKKFLKSKGGKSTRVLDKKTQELYGIEDSAGLMVSKGLLGIDSPPHIHVSRKIKLTEPRATFLHETGHLMDTGHSALARLKAKNRTTTFGKEFSVMAAERAANTNARNLIKRTSKNPEVDLADYDAATERAYKTYKHLAVAREAGGIPSSAMWRQLSPETVKKFNKFIYDESGTAADLVARSRMLHNVAKRLVPEYKRSVIEISRKHKDQLSLPQYNP